MSCALRLCGRVMNRTERPGSYRYQSGVASGPRSSPADTHNTPTCTPAKKASRSSGVMTFGIVASCPNRSNDGMPPVSLPSLGCPSKPGGTSPGFSPELNATSGSGRTSRPTASPTDVTAPDDLKAKALAALHRLQRLSPSSAFSSTTPIRATSPLTTPPTYDLIG